MHLKLTASETKPPLGSLVVRELLANSGLPIEVEWGSSTVLAGLNPANLVTDAAISRYFARLKPELNLYGSRDLDHAQVSSREFTASDNSLMKIDAIFRCRWRRWTM